MAETNIKYAGSVAAVITLNSLASDVTLLAGQESTVINNTITLFDDAILSGKLTTGTAPTAGKIEIWAYSAIDDSPAYPDVFDGADSAETVTSAEIKFSILRLVASIATDATADQTYSFAPRSVLELFGFMPTHYGFFVTHSTVAALHVTAGNHFIKTNGITYTVV